MQARAGGSADGRDGGIMPAAKEQGCRGWAETHSESIAFQCLGLLVCDVGSAEKACF